MTNPRRIQAMDEPVLHARLWGKAVSVCGQRYGRRPVNYRTDGGGLHGPVTCLQCIGLPDDKA